MKENFESGLSRERLELISAAVKKDVESKKYDGGVILVARHGVVGLQEAIGFANRKTNRPCRLDDIFYLMSVTKIFSLVILLSQMEHGYLSLTTRVTDIISEFKGGYKEQVTVFHLLTHTAGAPMEHFTPGESLIGEHSKVINTAIRMSLTSAPGQKVNYSALWAHTMVCEIIRRLDGGKRDLPTIYQEKLFGPLKMKDTDMGRRGDLVSRLVPIVVCGQMPGTGGKYKDDPNNIVDTNIDPGCGISTIQDLFRFTEMLRRGGELDGVRILSPTTIKLATTIQTGSMPNEMLTTMFAEHGWPPLPANIGFEILVRGEGANYPSSMGSFTSPRTFGKFGTGSVGFWIDPERDVTFIFLSVGLLHEYINFFRFARFADMAMATVI